MPTPPPFRRTSRTAALPESEQALQQAIAHSRKLLHRRALIGAVASTVPVPGLDWAVDATLLSKLLPRINEAFGLSPAQLDQLTPSKREQIQKAGALVGSVIIGKFVTREMVLRLAKTIGMRMGAKQAAKYVPLAGQAIAATLGYAALRYLGEQHVKDCIRVVREVQALAEPAAAQRR